MHIGDFRSGTFNMPRVNRWIYRDLLDVYYDTEQPLPLDLDQVCDLIGIDGDSEKQIVAKVLRQKFTETPQGWRHKRCDEEIAAYHEKSEESDKRREHEQERQRRHRERRAELFAKLREHGVIPEFDTSTKELQTLANNITSQGSNAPVTRDKQVCPPDATAITKNQEPRTNNQEPRTKGKRKDPAPAARALSLNETALAVLDYLNLKADRNYQPVESNTKWIVARLKEGATHEQCRAVVDIKVKEWATDPKMMMYLRPETVFGGKFFGYLGGANAAAKQPQEAQSSLGKAGQATARAAMQWMEESDATH
jgi:uncharacterized phage protein (TIGR02220 family)